MGVSMGNNFALPTTVMGADNDDGDDGDARA